MQLSFSWNSSELNFRLRLGLRLVCETEGKCIIKLEYKLIDKKKLKPCGIHFWKKAEEREPFQYHEAVMSYWQSKYNLNWHNECIHINLVSDGQPCPVVLWDPSLSPVDQPSERLNWGSYQTSLKHKCWHRGVIPKPEWSCTSIHHHEWSKLVVFDFLLQVLHFYQ